MILLSDVALANVVRLDATAAGARNLIKDAVLVLDEHPFIGREVEAGMRELVISKDKTGCVALYDYDESRATVTVLAIRHQRELDYPL